MIDKNKNFVIKKILIDNWSPIVDCNECAGCLIPIATEVKESRKIHDLVLIEYGFRSQLFKLFGINLSFVATRSGLTR